MDTTKSWLEKLTKTGIVVLAALFIIVSYLMFHAGRYRAITDINGMDYGQLSWNIAHGRGYTTDLIRPLSLAKHLELGRHPELTDAPVHPYIASLFMRTMPEKGRALALACGLGFLLTVPVVFFLGWQLFDLRTGILGMALFVTNLSYLQYSISGLETTWLTLWVSVLFLVLYGLSRKLRWRYHLAAVAGVVMGLLYLTQYVWVVALPLAAIYIYLSSDKAARWQTTGVFVLAFALLASPWWVRNLRVTGNPVFTFRTTETIMATRSNPGNTLYRQFTTAYPSLAWYMIDRPVEMMEKVRSGVMMMYRTLPSIAGWYVTPFFLVGIVVVLGTKTFERLRYLWYAMFLTVFATLTVVAAAERLLIPLGPCAGVLAAGFFLRLVDTRLGDVVPQVRRRYLTLAIALLVGLHALPLLLSLFRFREVSPQVREAVRTVEWVREVASITDGPIITDVPWLFAWYADRTAIWLPKTRADLRNLEDKVGKIRWLLLTPRVASADYDRFERTLKEWGPAYREGALGDAEFEGYKVHKRIAGGRWVLFQADPAAKRDLPPEVMERYRRSPEQDEAEGT